jgi:hypothetical protein
VTEEDEAGMNGIKIFVAVMAVFAVVTAYALAQPQYPQATGILPQVVSYVHENPSDPGWKPTLRVKVEPIRNPGRVREYRVLGCRLYYHHRFFR